MVRLGTREIPDDETNNRQNKDQQDPQQLCLGAGIRIDDLGDRPNIQYKDDDAK
jgi:hypothetical protein